MVERARAGPQRRPAQGRRPVRLRPRRRGGRDAGRGRGRVRGRPRGHRRGRRAGLRRDPGHPPRRRLGGRLRHRPRGPREGRDGARLGGAGALPGHARPLHGGQEPAADRRAAARPPGATRPSPRRRSSAAPSPASGRWPSTLAELPGAVAEAGLRAPAILLFGPVAARRETIAWLERRPLHGRRVVVTRARAQASGLAATLRGARRRGGRAAGDPDRAAARQPPRSATRSPTCTPTRSSA